MFAGVCLKLKKSKRFRIQVNPKNLIDYLSCSLHAS